MLGVGVTELTLVKYLIGQLRLSAKPTGSRVLREFAPSAVDSDWELDGRRPAGAGDPAGQGHRRRAGVRHHRAESADGSIAGLLGASPGASTAVPAMLDVLQRCFPDRYQAWQPKLKEMVPSLGAELSDEPALYDEVWAWGTKVLTAGRPDDPRDDAEPR